MERIKEENLDVKCWLCNGKIYGTYDTRILILSKHKHKICSYCAARLKEKPFMDRPSYGFDGGYE